MAARIVNLPAAFVCAVASRAPSLPIKPTLAWSTGLPSSGIRPLTFSVPGSAAPPQPANNATSNAASSPYDCAPVRFGLRFIGNNSLGSLGQGDGFLVGFVAEVVISNHVDVLRQKPHSAVAKQKLRTTRVQRLEAYLGVPTALCKAVVLPLCLSLRLRPTRIDIDRDLRKCAPAV